MELSVFVDESGDFGEYDYHAPYYIISLVFHNQSHDIQFDLSHFNDELAYLNLSNHCVHAGPIIRSEEEYKGMSLDERRKNTGYFHLPIIIIYFHNIETTK